LWPTASASGFEAADLPALLSRREECKARKVNGNGFGLTLNQAVKLKAAGLWPTATEGDHKASGTRTGTPNSHPGTTLTDAANGLWASPASRDWRGDSHAPAAQRRNSPCLPAHVGLVDPESPSTSGKSRDWPTSQARDWKGSQGRAYRGESMDLPATDGRGTLNSRWVAQLMGYPPDWLDVGTESHSRLWATRSSRKSLPSSDKQ
jgi:hypothetical protein